MLAHTGRVQTIIKRLKIIAADMHLSGLVTAAIADSIGEMVNKLNRLLLTSRGSNERRGRRLANDEEGGTEQVQVTTTPTRVLRSVRNTMATMIIS